MMKSKIKCYLPICSLTAIPKVHMMEFTVNRRTVQLNKQIMTPALDGGPLEILSANRKITQFVAMESCFIKPH